MYEITQIHDIININYKAVEDDKNLATATIWGLLLYCN
jgi:hypothetical protein